MVGGRANVPPKGRQALMDWIWAIIDTLIPWPGERRYKKWLERHPRVLACFVLLIIGLVTWALIPNGGR